MEIFKYMVKGIVVYIILSKLDIKPDITMKNILKLGILSITTSSFIDLFL